MEASQMYILISIAALLIIVALVFLIKKNKGKKEKTFTPLAGIAFAFLIFGILFGDNRLVGYGLMGVGVLFAIIDIVQKSKKK